MPKLETPQAPTFPGPLAEAMYWSNASICGIQGPVGSGKTTTLLKSRIRRAVEMPRSVLKEARHGIEGHWRLYKLTVARETYRQLWATTIPSYLEVYPRDLGTWSGGRGDPVTHVIVFEDEHGPIDFRVEFMAYGDNIIASMRGLQTTDLWPNELDTMRDEVLSVGIGRINRWPGRHHFEGYSAKDRSYGQVVADFNAPDEENFVHALFHSEGGLKVLLEEINDKLGPDDPKVTVEFYNQPGYGEPGCENLKNLAANYYPTQIAAMKATGRGDLVTRLVHNKPTTIKVGDPVFSREFNRQLHVSPTPLEVLREYPIRIGLDQGFKGAAVILQFVPPFHWRVLAELHFPKERLMAAVFGGRLRQLLDERFNGHRVEAAWGDMAGEHGASQAADENDNWNRLVAAYSDITVRPQRIGTNRLGPRLEAIRAPLEFISGGQPGILIDPSCRFLIRAFEGRYVWTEEVNKQGDKRKVPDKSFTEANVMDALQYVCLSEVMGDGRMPTSLPGTNSTQMGHNGGPSLDEPRGLTTAYDILNPY